jgi:hypothetical protein
MPLLFDSVCYVQPETQQQQHIRVYTLMRVLQVRTDFCWSDNRMCGNISPHLHIPYGVVIS